MDTSLLKGKRGIVFGVANERSLAWACAQECLAHGALLAFSYLGAPQEKRLRHLLGDSISQTIVKPCDVSSDDSIAQFFAEIAQQWGQIDFIIHSVAYAEKENLKLPFVQTSRQDFARSLDVSSFSLIAVVQAALPFMCKHGGSIIAMSYYGAEKVTPNYNIMGVAKAALEASARYLAADVGQYNIRVNCISAGPIRTLSSSAISGLRDMLHLAQHASPLRRAITSADVAKAAVYLLSDLAAGVTGEVHHVDCGLNILGMLTIPTSQQSLAQE